MEVSRELAKFGGAFPLPQTWLGSGEDVGAAEEIGCVEGIAEESI